ncbi:RNA-directed DNA polymerase, eukaryota, reverse transcriptase zinc-binding domain protein [Tanacetum coccineum]
MYANVVTPDRVMNKNVPIILKKLSLNTNPSKEDLIKLPVWVKLHNILVAAFTSDGLSRVDEAGNPLKKVEYPDDYDSEDEVASVDNDMAHSMASERVGFGTQSLLEQWRDSYGNGDYDDDPYDDDMYEGHDLSQELQAICDNLDIRVRGRKKK